MTQDPKKTKPRDPPTPERLWRLRNSLQTASTPHVDRSPRPNSPNGGAPQGSARAPTADTGGRPSLNVNISSGGSSSKMLAAPAAVSDSPVRPSGHASSNQLTAASRLVAYSKRTSRQGSQSADFSAKLGTVLLQIRLETSPQILPQFSEFAAAYTRLRFHPRTAEKLALASYELIENAISYGSISADVVYSLIESDAHVEVCVANDASSGRLSNLRTRIERIRVDPELAFQEEMMRSVTNSGARAALGLARICHEGQMDLEFEVDGNRVTMRARCTK